MVDFPTRGVQPWDSGLKAYVDDHDRETLGAKLRRLARSAKNGNPRSRPYMKSMPPWQPSTAVLVGTMVVNGGNQYVCGTAGTTAATGGPTATASTAITDGTAKWYYYGVNQVTQDPATSTPAWAATTAYTLGQQRVNAGHVYACVVAGTSAGSGGPTTQTNSVVDGTVTWTWMGAVYANPYVSDFPTYQFGSAAPAGQTATYIASAAGAFTAGPMVSLVSGGTGYVVGEVLTIAGGTFTTPAKVTVRAVSGGVITKVEVTTPGLYSILPTTVPVSQSASTGAGTGATINLHFSQPGWCRIRGGDPIRNQSGFFTVCAASQGSPGAAELQTTLGIDFMSDAPMVTFRVLQSTTVVADFQVIVDGVRYNASPLDQPVNASQANYYSLAFPSGRKTRRWQIERNNSTGFSIPTIYVDSNSQVWAPDPQDDIKAVGIGDSLWVGASSGPYATGNSLTLGLRHELGWADVRNLGIGTTGWVTQNPANTGGNAFGFRIDEALLFNPDIWLIKGSWNDMPVDPALVTAAVVAGVQKIRDGGSKAPIVLIGIWSAPGSVPAQIAATEAAVASGVAADPLGLTFFIPISGDPVAPWITYTGNNNPAPNGLVVQGTNASLYVDTPNSPHDPDIGTKYKIDRVADAIRKYVLPVLK